MIHLKILQNPETKTDSVCAVVARPGEDLHFFLPKIPLKHIEEARDILERPFSGCTNLLNFLNTKVKQNQVVANLNVWNEVSKHKEVLDSMEIATLLLALSVEVEYGQDKQLPFWKICEDVTKSYLESALSLLQGHMRVLNISRIRNYHMFIRMGLKP